MSGKFDGFSEDDISKLKTPRSSRTKKSVFNERGIQRMPDSFTNATDEVPRLGIKLSVIDHGHEYMPNTKETLNLSVTSTEESIHFRPVSSQVEQPDESILHVENGKEKPLPSQSNLINKFNCESSSTLPSTSFRGVSLKDFETQRKLIEEQNKQKKEMLYKAIELQ